MGLLLAEAEFETDCGAAWAAESVVMCGCALVDHLFLEHLMHARGNMFSLNLEDLRDVDDLSRLKVMLRRFISANAADPDLTRILIHEGMNDSPRLKWLAKRYMVRGYATFNAAIETAIESGAVRRLPVRDVTNIIVGACVLTFTLSRLLKEVYGELPTSAEAVTSLSDTLLEVLFKGLEARRRP